MKIDFKKGAEKMHALTKKIFDVLPITLLPAGGVIGAIYGIATVTVAAGSFASSFLGATPYVLGCWLAGGAVGVGAGLAVAGGSFAIAKVCHLATGKYGLKDKSMAQVQKIKAKLPNVKLPSVDLKKFKGINIKETFNKLRQDRSQEASEPKPEAPKVEEAQKPAAAVKSAKTPS